jgi:hypothetical protein
MLYEVMAVMLAIVYFHYKPRKGTERIEKLGQQT